MKPLEIKIKRWKGPQYSIGKLSLDGTYFCDTLEDFDRGLKQTDPLHLIQKLKVNGLTAIPTGRYKIVMDVKSPKYSNYTKYPWARAYNGNLPRLLNVPGFEGILVHVGNYPKHTSGCILVGINNIKGAVTQSINTFNKLMQRLIAADDDGREI